MRLGGAVGGLGGGFVQGFYGESITEEKITSFDAVAPPAMGGPKISPNETVNDVSDTSSLD